MVVLAALRARLRGWQPSGKFTLGGWGLPVNVLALTWGIMGIICLIRPLGGDGVAWYDNWSVLISGLIVLAVGLIYQAVHPTAWAQGQVVIGLHVRGLYKVDTTWICNN